MGCLLVTYDLNTPGQNYKELYEAIKGLGSSWWHYLDSTWLVHSTLNPSQASERLRPAMDKNDNLLVLNVTGDAAGGWLPQEAWDWINQHMR